MNNILKTNSTKKLKTDLDWFKSCLKNKELVEKLKKIKLIITDVDGSLTDGQICYSESLSQTFSIFGKSKNFSVQDGFATSKIIKNNILHIAFLSGRADKVTNIRAENLGISKNMCIAGENASENKIPYIKQIQKSKNISKNETLIFGDDFLDFEAKENAEILACPENTPFYFQNSADLIFKAKIFRYF